MFEDLARDLRLRVNLELDLAPGCGEDPNMIGIRLEARTDLVVSVDDDVISPLFSQLFARRCEVVAGLQGKGDDYARKTGANRPQDACKAPARPPKATRPLPSM